MTAKSTSFPVIDRPEVKSTVVDGIHHLGDPDRDIVQDFGFIEPLDERSDEFVSIPLRSALHYGGPGFEFGPFSLGANECIDLYNALADHINNFRLAKAVTA